MPGSRQAPPTQATLFDDASPERAVVTVLGNSKPADRAQASFHRLIRQIEAERARLEDWRAYMVRYAQRISSELEPPRNQLLRARCDFARLLDAAYRQPGMVRGKRMRAKLRAAIVELIESLLAQQPDAELSALYDHYSDVPHAELNAMSIALAEDMIENMFGFRMEADHGATSMEELLELAKQKFSEEAARGKSPHARAKPRSAAAESKRAEAEKQVSQSVREVYRKLASALHPDRASADLSHARKTELMARVNRAYQDGNLLELLNVQLEIEQIDAAHLANLSGERLAHFNRVLRDQLQELQQELRAITQPFRALVPHVGTSMRPQHIDVALDAELANLREMLREAEVDLERMREPANLLAFLKDHEVDAVPSDALELAMLEEIFGDEPPSPRRRAAKSPGKAKTGKARKR